MRVDIDETFQIYQSAENYVAIDVLPSTFLDAIIALKTIKVVIFGKGR